MDRAELKEGLVEEASSLGRWIGLRGVITLLLGIWFLARPGNGVAVLVTAFGIYCFADAVFAFAAAFSDLLTTRSRVLLVLEGLVGVAAGVAAFARPGEAAVVILYIVALRALIVGALEVIGAISLGDAIGTPWVMALSGLASVIFGILLLRHPSEGLIALAWLVGVYAVVAGAIQIGAAFEIRRMLKQTPPAAA